MSSRYYESAAGAAAVSPAFDAYYNATGQALRRALLAAKDGSDTLANGTVITWTAGQKALDRQYVGPPMAAQTITGTVKSYKKSSETLATCNSIAQMGIRVCSNDGSTFRGTLLAPGDYAGATELASAASTNKAFALAGTTLSSVDAQLGDRLVISFGFTDASGSSPNGRSVYGSSAASDLPEDETDTTAKNGWVEFSQTLVLDAVPTPDTLALTIATFAPSITTSQVPSPGTLALVLTKFAPSVLQVQVAIPQPPPKHGVKFAMHPRLARGVQYQRKRPK